MWSLHALSLIADSGGPLFRNFVDSTLSLLVSLLLHVNTISVDMYRCLGNCLSALLTTLGPELQIESPSMSETRDMCLSACAILQVRERIGRKREGERGEGRGEGGEGRGGEGGRAKRKGERRESTD